MSKPSESKGTDTYEDPFCNPDNPKEVKIDEIWGASKKIKDVIYNTPCTKSKMSPMLNMDVYFKKEFMQYTGSFKERGARYALMMLSEDDKEKGVIAASAGNHALALAYHGQLLNIKVTVIMPIIAPIMKVQACKYYKADVIIKGKDISESKQHALKLGKEKGFIYINGYDHPHILAGQGTMGLEIAEQVPDMDAVVIPVGGGGLIAGSAVVIRTLKPDVKIIGVESESCTSFSEARTKNKPTVVDMKPSIADGLSVPEVGVNAFKTANELIDGIVTVKEESIALAILRLIELEKAIVEGAGAVGLAAILEGSLSEFEGKKVVVALCGGNIDTTTLGHVIERGLATDGRLFKFEVTLKDTKGALADLTNLLSDEEVSIKDIYNQRAWLHPDVFTAQVKFVVETRDKTHLKRLEAALNKKYKDGQWKQTEF